MKFEDFLRLLFFKELLLLLMFFEFILFLMGILIDFGFGNMKFFCGIEFIFFNDFFWRCV